MASGIMPGYGPEPEGSDPEGGSPASGAEGLLAGRLTVASFLCMHVDPTTRSICLLDRGHNGPEQGEKGSFRHHSTFGWGSAPGFWNHRGLVIDEQGVVALVCLLRLNSWCACTVDHPCSGCNPVANFHVIPELPWRNEYRKRNPNPPRPDQP